MTVGGMGFIPERLLMMMMMMMMMMISCPMDLQCPIKAVTLLVNDYLCSSCRLYFSPDTFVLMNSPHAQASTL